MIRVGLLGAGWVASHHLAAWKRMAPVAKVVAIADPDLDKAARLAGKFGVPAFYASAQELFQHCDIEVADIAAPRELHVPLVRLAAARGLAVLCQKPLADSYVEAVDLVGGLGGQTRLMVHENWRFRPYYRQLATWLGENRLGAVHHVNMELLSSGLLADRSGTRSALERQPFLAGLHRMLVSEILIHHIDTLRFLLGELEVVHARIGRTCSQIRGEDRVSVLFETREGVPVTLTGDLHTHGAPPVLTDRLRIVGDAGAAVLDDSVLRLDAAHGAEVLAFDHDAAYADSYAGAIRHFITCLATGSEFETRPADNLETLLLVEKIYAQGSLESHQT